MDHALIALASPLRKEISIGAAFGLTVTACHVGQGVCLAFGLSAMLQGQPFGDAFVWIVACAGVVALRMSLIWGSEVAAQTIARRTKQYLRRRLLLKLIELGPGGLLRHDTGDLQTTLVGAVEALEGYQSRYLPALIGAAIGAPLVLLALALFDLRSALVAGAFVAAFWIADTIWMRWRMPKSSYIFAAMAQFASFLIDSIQGVLTLKLFGATARRRIELERLARHMRCESMATLSLTLARTGFTGFFTLGGVAAVTAYNSLRIVHHEVGPEVLFAGLLLSREGFRPLERLEKAFHAAWAAKSAIEPVKSLLGKTPAVCEAAAPSARGARADIVFENVTFGYEGGDAQLHSVSFNLPERTITALVGTSGVGKSTIISLLLRLFDVQAGSIRIGGVDIRRIELNDLYALFGVVSQDAYLFDDTIEANLRIAKPEASHQEIRDAAEIAQIQSFIEGLPKGYATQIGERGVALSGGQRQRLSIARAVLKDAPILLLDEATSNMDAANEQAIHQALRRLSGRRTILVIAHRLSTIRDADQIMVLDKGKIAEAGNHGDLVRAGGVYSALVEAQGAAA